MSIAQRRARPRSSGSAHSLETLIVNSRIVAYLDAGDGPVIIPVHCSSGSHHMWEPLVTAAVSAGYRLLVPDLVGYGRSQRWPANTRFDPWSDVNAVLALADRAGAPVHLVGHSYGGVVALEAARQLGSRVRGMTLIEPGAFHLLQLAGRSAEWDELVSVGDRVVDSVKRWREREATSVYMRYWIGRRRWWAMSPRARRSVVQTIGKVAAEFDVVRRLERTLGDYMGIVAPTRLIEGGRSPRPARAIVEELLHILPNAHRRVLDGTSHLSPLTHQYEVLALAAEHIDAIERDVRVARTRRLSTSRTRSIHALPSTGPDPRYWRTATSP